MIIVVTGSRGWVDKTRLEYVLKDVVEMAMKFGPPGEDIELWEGGAGGTDRMAFNWAHANGLDTRTFRADWSRCTDAVFPDITPCTPDHRKNNLYRGPYCPTAGIRRNSLMVQTAKKVLEEGSPVVGVAFIRRNSSGASDCLRRMDRLGINVITERD